MKSGMIDYLVVWSDEARTLCPWWTYLELDEGGMESFGGLGGGAKVK